MDRDNAPGLDVLLAGLKGENEPQPAEPKREPKHAQKNVQAYVDRCAQRKGEAELPDKKPPAMLEPEIEKKTADGRTIRVPLYPAPEVPADGAPEPSKEYLIPTRPLGTIMRHADELRQQREADQKEFTYAVLGADEPPAAEKPELAEFEAWLPDFPPAAKREADARLAPLIHGNIGETEPRGEWRLNEDGHLYALFPSPDSSPSVRLPLAYVGTLWEEAIKDANGEEAFDPDREGAHDFRPSHPLAPLVQAWLDRPPLVETNRKPWPLLPDIRVGGETPERERGRVFGGFVPEGAEPDQLPLFGSRPGGIIERVPLLGIADATTGGAVTAQGRGAPLELAVPVEAMLAIEPADRRLDTVRVVLTVKELRDAFWPNDWQRNRDWPRLQHVLEGLGSRFVPLEKGYRWYPLSLVGMPEAADDLDELVILDVRMPPGSDQGTPIERRRLAELRVHSGGAYRAMIATAALAWQPGTTRVKVKGRWLWAADTRRYPILTKQDRREIIFGNNPRRRNTAEVDGPFEVLEKAGDIIIAGRDVLDAERQETGWRIVPADAATERLRDRLAS